MAEKHGRSKRETWREWCAFGAPGSDPWRNMRSSPGPWPAGDHLPDPELVTREALLLKLERWGVKGVTERNLRHWEDAGLLPRATLEGPPGKQRALYPWWAAELVARLRQLQDEGLPTPRLSERLRAEAHQLSRDMSRAGGAPPAPPRRHPIRSPRGTWRPMPRGSSASAPPPWCGCSRSGIVR